MSAIGERNIAAPPAMLLWRVMGVTPAHVHVAVFGGPAAGARALLGNLTFRPEQWLRVVSDLPGDIEWRGFADAVALAARR